MLKRRTRVAVLAGMALIGGTARAQQDDSVLWGDSSHRLATFISGPVLTVVERESEDQIPRDTPLPLGGAQAAKRGLQAFLKETLDGLAAHPELDKFCPHHNEGVSLRPEPTQPKSISLAELARRADIAVVGTVERVVPGIYLASMEVATHTLLRIDEVLRDETHSIHARQTVSFLRIGGTLAYKGTMLCTDSAGQHIPAAGDHLLLMGGHGDWEADPGELYPRWLFVIENGSVIPDAKAHPFIAESEAKPVSMLRAELATKNPSHD